jgi:hypothetical protein
MFLVLGFTLAATLGTIAPVSAQDTGDPVIVTVTGAVENTNRGAFDAETDVFFKHHELNFHNAHAFTRGALAALGMQEITLAYAEEWSGERTFRGPRLADVLAAVGASGDTVTVQALDGYGLALDRKMIEDGQFILALVSNGEPLAIGGFGPAWLVYPPEDWTHPTVATNSGLVWSIFHIAVE